jgi:membrane-bound metal-dependent hydrolase YbcI (DUF457 family)
VLCRHYEHEPKLGECLLCVGVGLITAGVPDIVEPAIYPCHRQLAHSVTAGGLMTKIAMEKCGGENGWDFQNVLLTVAIAGYVSHLVLDGCTPRGLPLLGS